MLPKSITFMRPVTHLLFGEEGRRDERELRGKVVTVKVGVRAKLFWHQWPLLSLSLGPHFLPSPPFLAPLIRPNDHLSLFCQRNSVPTSEQKFTIILKIL